MSVDVDEIKMIIWGTVNNTQWTGRQSIAPYDRTDHRWDDLVGDRAIHANPVGWH